jgi:hypothetical protein
MSGSNCSMAALTWQQARASVKKVNPALAQVIDRLSPDDSYSLFKVRYPFGAPILKRTQLMLPHKGRLAAADSADIAPEIQEQLCYNGTVPMGLVLHHGMEQHIELADRVLPYDFFEPGDLFALSKTFESTPSLNTARVWHLTAGARSLFMLPKISDEQSHRKLRREFQLHADVPRELNDQWSVFSELAGSHGFENKWYVEVLYFSKKWLSHRESQDVGWNNFYQHLFQIALDKSQFFRHYVILNLAFSRAQVDRNLRPDPYLADTVEHLITMRAGAALGFCVANDESAGPIFELEKIYTEVYRLRNQYAAAFMRPYRFDRTRPNQPVYYSLRQPTALEFSPRARKVASTMSDLHEVKHVLKTVMKDFSERRDLVGTPLSEFARLSEINFYHTEKDALSEALPVGGLATADPAFPVLFERQKGLKLCESSPFLKGCVTIAAKDLSDDQE